MKNLYLPKKLEEESIVYLNRYFKKKKRSLTKKQKTYIQKLIEKRRKEIEKEVLLYENSSLLHLAQVELVRERRAIRTTNNGKVVYKIKSVGELFLKMIEIVNLAHDKGYGDFLNTI